jgi:hypothetical protein
MKSGALRHLASASSTPNPVFRLLDLMLGERGLNVETVKGDDKLSSQPNATHTRHFNPTAGIPRPPPTSPKFSNSRLFLFQKYIIRYENNSDELFKAEGKSC